MDLYFGGTEQRMWRDLLRSEGVKHVSLSYIGLRRRIKDPANLDLAAMYPGQYVYLDSGAFTLNNDNTVSSDTAWELAQMYADFVTANIGAIEFASEFDATVLGDRVAQMRETFWQALPPDKWMPVWHSDAGTEELQRLVAAHSRVGVLQSDTRNSDIGPVLRQLADRTKFHGIAMTRMDAMRELPWASVGSTSWLSTTQYGDTFVWTGRELKRYPRAYKDQARKRHRTWLGDQGFDVDKIEADDNAELLRLSIWSWRKFADSLNSKREVTMPVLDPFGQNTETSPDAVDTQGVYTGNMELAPRSGKKLLPVLGITYSKGHDDAGNDTDIPHLTTPSSGLLQCNTCFMRDKCPEAQPGSDCVFEIPAKVRTTTQLAALQDWLIETQAQRVAFMRLIEQVQGGYADANLSAEMASLQRMIKAKQDVSREGFSLRIEGSATPGGPGMISRIFGSNVSDKMSALPEPIDAQAIIEAEIVEIGE